MSDSWAHRGAGMRCRTCMWFVAKAPATERKPTEAKLLSDTFDSKPALGRCRRHAPTMSGWPAVFEGDFCGDHKLDENKL